MPVSPKEASKNITEAEEKAYLQAVEMIDKELPKVYMGYGEVCIRILVTPGLTSRTAQRLRDEYNRAGWRYVTVDLQKGIVKLAETTPTNPYDR